MRIDQLIRIDSDGRKSRPKSTPFQITFNDLQKSVNFDFSSNQLKNKSKIRIAHERNLIRRLRLLLQEAGVDFFLMVRIRREQGSESLDYS